jgi:integrase
MMDVQVDPELMSVFRGYAATASAGSNFVIDDHGAGEVDQYWDHYRAKAVFERLSVWLRKHGITAKKPIHELRKEFGSMVNRKHGLSAASDQLRHSGIATTAAYYIDRPRKATSGIGPLLLTKRRKGKKIVQFKDALVGPARGMSK